VLSQGKQRDAAVNFDTYRVFNGIMRFLCHIRAFLYTHQRPFKMLKLHTVRWFSRPWRKIMAIAENHGTRPRSRKKVTVIVNTWLSYSAIRNVTITVHAHVRYFRFIRLAIYKAYKRSNKHCVHERESEITIPSRRQPTVVWRLLPEEPLGIPHIPYTSIN